MTIEQRIEHGNLVRNGLKVYISGKITGLDMTTAIENFEGAETFLESIGMEPVNPLKDADQSQSWQTLMVRDIEMLFECKAIYMMSNWCESKGARIEKYIAEQTGMMVLYEKTMVGFNSDAVRPIINAIEEIIGLSPENYTVRGKSSTESYFAKIIFTHFCSKQNVPVNKITEMLNRSEVSIYRYISNFEKELQYNKHFKSLVSKIENYLKNNVSQ